MAWLDREPRIVGNAWQPSRRLGTLLDADGECAAMRLTSSVAETIDKLVFYFDQVNAPGFLLTEVFPAGSEVPGLLTTDIFRPNEDSAVSNMTNEVGAVVNLFASIDDPVLNTADYIKNVSPPAEASYTCKLDSAAFPAGRRVTDLRIVVVGEQILGTMEWNLELRRQGSGFIRVDRRYHSPIEGVFTVSISVGELNPFTGLPWTQADITSFDSTIAADRLSLVFRQKNLSTIFDGGYIYQAWIEVDSVPENRVAVGRSLVSVPAFATSFDLKNPNTGADNWPKAAATDYSYALRRVPAPGSPGVSTGGPKGTSTAQVSWLYLVTDPDQTIDDLTLDGAESFAPTLNEDGAITAMGAASNLGYFLVQRTTAPATSVDGQPYDSFTGTQLNSGVVYRQEVTPISSGVVRQVVFLAFLASDDFLPSAPVIAQVYVDATNVAVGGPATITVDDLKASPGVGAPGKPGIKQVIAELSSAAALVAGTQYRIEFTTTSPPSDPPWQILAYESTFGYGVTTWGGAVDRGDIGSGYDADVDLAAALLAPPFTPRDMTALVDTIPTGNVGDCGVDDVDRVLLEWALPPGVDPDAYVEIERSSDGGSTWEPLATVFDQAVTSFVDYEAPRTYPGLVDCVCYRWRLVDVIPSDWTPVPPTCGSLTIVDDGSGTAGPIGEVDDASELWLTLGAWERDGAELLTTTAAGTRRLALANTAQTDYYVEATVGTFRDSGWGIAGRFEDASNYVYAFLDPGTSSWQIRHAVAGFHTTIAGPVVATTISGTVARLVFTSPNMVELLVNAISILGPVAHSATLDSPLGGLFANTGTTPANRWDDFTFDAPSVCVAPVAYGCELVFSSNESGQIFAYSDVYAAGSTEKRRYTFLDADRVRIFPIFDRDRQVAFQPSERLGDEWTVRLVLSSIDDPVPGPGRVVFDEFVAFSRADLPYITVLDQYGRRWIAVLRIPEGIIFEPGKTYVVPATITEVAVSPLPTVIPAP
jgi:hypothetical protein